MRHLFALARVALREKQPEAEVRRYVTLARRIGMRYQVSLPRELRRQVCRGCGALLVAASTARHRIANGRLSITCLACGEVKRYPFRPARKVNA